MASMQRDFSATEHDWHSDTYVDWWIERDAGREAVRRARLRAMLALTPYAPDAAIEVLDIGGGYGVLTEEVLRAFPGSRVTLQDYSAPMLDAARRRLGAAADRVTFLLGDLRERSWREHAGGPFDLAVSSIAIHNLRDLDRIADCYRDIVLLLKPGALFLDYDVFDVAGGTAVHSQLIEQAGLVRVACPWQEPPAAIIAAYAPG